MNLRKTFRLTILSLGVLLVVVILVIHVIIPIFFLKIEKILGPVTITSNWTEYKLKTPVEAFNRKAFIVLEKTIPTNVRCDEYKKELKNIELFLVADNNRELYFSSNMSYGCSQDNNMLHSAIRPKNNIAITDLTFSAIRIRSDTDINDVTLIWRNYSF